MRVVIILFFMLMVQLRTAKAQEEEDFLYTNDLGVTFGFEGDTKKGDNRFLAERYIDRHFSFSS